MIGTAWCALPHLGARIENFSQNFSCCFAEMLASRRQPRRNDGAVDQRRTDPRFELLDATAERRLRRIALLGGTGEIPGLCHGEKILKPAN